MSNLFEKIANAKEESAEVTERVRKAAQCVEKRLAEELPGFDTSEIKGLPALFNFVARAGATHRSYQLALSPGAPSTAWNDYRYGLKGLLFSGGTGTGKTTLAEFVARHVGAYRFTAPELDFDFSNWSWSDFSDAYETLLWPEPADTLIIDDFGSECSRKRYGNAAFTDDLIERLYEYWCRYNPVQSVLTTNLGYTEIRTRYGDRAASRILEMYDFITFGNTDRRRNFLRK